MIKLGTHFKHHIVYTMLAFVGVALFFGLSYRYALNTAEDTMRPYSTIAVHAYTDFKPIGYRWGPTWIFYYDSPEAFDAAPFTVVVNVFGRLRAVHAPRLGLWDNDAHRWVVVPERSGDAR